MVKLRDATADPARSAPPERFASLDALRGILLLLLVGHGFGLREMLPQEQWNWITLQWSHREWLGCSLWDLLPTGMLFAVGVAMPFSYANRRAKGQRWPAQFWHALKRTGLLLLLGMYLDSYRENRLVFDVRGDLQQIALAYLLTFLVLPLGMVVHGVAVVLLLFGHTLAHVIYGLMDGHELWSQTHNLGVVLDPWLHLRPHAERYTTLNILPATAIVLSGVLIADLVRGDLTPGHKVVIMTLASIFCILSGWLLSGGNDWYVFIPMIRRLGTVTFVLVSVGWILLVFTYFYTLMEGFLWRSWALPITLVGRNSLILYMADQLFRYWAVRSARLVLPDSPPIVKTLQPLFVELIVVVIFWLFCVWLYRRRIFFKV
jgi:predicted acyltransferase